MFCVGLGMINGRRKTTEPEQGPNENTAQGNATKGNAPMHGEVVELRRDPGGVFGRKHNRSVMLRPSWVSSSAPFPADG